MRGGCESRYCTAQALSGDQSASLIGCIWRPFFLLTSTTTSRPSRLARSDSAQSNTPTVSSTERVWQKPAYITHLSLVQMDIQTPNEADSAISRLPRELLDLVVSHLAQDKLALKHCTLVSRYWRVSTRALLFHTLSIHDHGGPQHYPPDFECCGDNQFAFDAFRRFLWSPPPLSRDLPPLIKSLKISYGWSDIHRTTINVADLDLVLARLPALDELYLRSLSLQAAPSGMKLHGWSYPKPLTKLVLWGITMELPSWATAGDQQRREATGCPFVELLGLFSDIKMVHATNVGFMLDDDERRWLYWDDDERTDAAVSQLSALRVQQLYLELDPYANAVPKSHADFLRLLDRSVSLQGLSSLNVTEEPAIVRAVLEGVGNRVESLGLTVSVAADDYTDQVRLHLNSLLCHIF